MELDVETPVESAVDILNNLTHCVNAVGAVVLSNGAYVSHPRTSPGGPEFEQADTGRSEVRRLVVKTL